MFNTRNVGYLKSDFKAGDDVTKFVFGEIKKRRPYWNGNVLYSIDLVADKPFEFEIDGWSWACNGSWHCHDALIRGLIINDDIPGLQIAFRYDD